jgi:hypothetical protein
MSETSNPTHGEPLQATSSVLNESKANKAEGTSAEQYKVGPGHPPADRRWKKGGPSPNPCGRPRKEQSMLPDVRKAFEQALNKKVFVPRGDRKVLMTRVEIGLEQLLNQFAKGDRHGRKDLMDYADKLGIDFLAKHRQTLEEALTPNYQAGGRKRMGSKRGRRLFAASEARAAGWVVSLPSRTSQGWRAVPLNAD